MADLRDLQRKLESIAALREIVQAMRNLAAVYVRRAESTLDATRPYETVVETGLATALERAHVADIPDQSEHPPIAIVFSSDQGLCGAYNERVVRTALQFCDEHPGTQLIAIGLRGRDMLAQRDIEPLLSVRAPTSLEGIKAQVPELSEQIFETYAKHGAGDLFFVYNMYESMGRFTGTTRRVLPPGRDKADTDAAETFRSEPLLTMPADELLSRLIEEHFFINLFRGLLESHASENGARLLSMTAASSNIDNRISVLTKEYQSARQEMVTAELLDVVGGAEALRGT